MTTSLARDVAPGAASLQEEKVAAQGMFKGKNLPPSYLTIRPKGVLLENRVPGALDR